MELLIIPYKLQPKERPRFSIHKGKIITYTPKKTHNFENLVKQQFYSQGCKKVDGCIEVKIQAYFGVKDKKKWGMLKDTRPDTDNIIKIMLDALNSLAWDDDGQVVKITAEKYYSSFDYAKVFYKKVNFF